MTRCNWNLVQIRKKSENNLGRQNSLKKSAKQNKTNSNKTVYTKALNITKYLTGKAFIEKS
jgi:hypothetical protein